jgi:Mrp family chromosome partitioning ATPase/uncharacterized protein involved in exopolysaccharide biosynthesis
MSEHDAAPQPLSRVDGLGGGPHRGHAPPEVRSSTAHYLEPESGLVEARGETGHARRPVSPRLLLRLKGTILGVFAALAVPAGAAIWLGLHPVYRAEALLEVRSLVPRFVQRTEETGLIPQYQQYLRTQVDIMTSATVLNRVLGREDVRQTAWYQEPDVPLARLRGVQDNPLERLQEAVVAGPRPGTELISIAVDARAPGDAAVMANGVLDEYLEFSRERLSDEDQGLFRQLDDERKKLEIQIGFSEGIVAEARKDLRTGSPDELIAQRRVRLDQLDAEVAQLAEQIEYRQQQLRELEAVSASQPAGADSGGAAVRYTDDAEWRRLYGEWRAAQQRADEAALQFQPAHPLRMRLEKTVEGARALVEERQAQLDKLAELGLPQPTSLPTSEAVAANPRALRHEVRQLELQKELRERRAKELRDSFEHEFNTAESLRKHSEDLDRHQTRLRAVQNRLCELEEKGRVPATIRTIGRAVPPARPYSDKRLRLSLAALVAALAAGLACAYLRTALSPQVQEVGDVNRSLRGAFLGYLPFEQGLGPLALEGEAGPGEGEAGASPHPLYAECVRMIRTALLNRLEGEVELRGPGGQVVQLASAGPGSGKSTLAVLLARSLAQSGKRVLLVDADMHRPSLAQHFAIALSPGLLDLLARGQGGAGGAREGEAGAREGEAGASPYHATSIPTLSVLPSGRSTRQEDQELLVNGTFSTLLAQWRGRFDFILLDGPPLLQSADAAILSRHADGTILVVRQRHCRRMALVEALAVLSSAGGKLLGTVFVGSGHEQVYGYGYGYAPGQSYRPGSAADQPLLE